MSLTFALFMAAILTSKIDNAAAISRYFLSYQVEHIMHEHRMALTEKSVRVGFTWADAMRNVRKRLLFKRRDYLFTTKDQASAFEYIETCKLFCGIFNVTKAILSHGIDTERVPVFKDGKDTGVTEEIKVGYIKFDNGSRILAFSSNANAMRVYGGDVGADEYAFHGDADAAYETMQGRVTWGFDWDIWSAHNGIDTKFNALAREAEHGKNGFHHRKITMEYAVGQGLVEKINNLTGKSMSPEEFIGDCKKRAGSTDVYEQAYNCNPKGTNSAIVQLTSIQLCSADYKIPRVHFENATMVAQFGAFTRETQLVRQMAIQRFLDTAFDALFQRSVHRSLGFDVAASGQGDLACIYIDEKKSEDFWLDALFTCRTDDWDFLQTVLWHFMRRLPSITGAGDETGLGKQICWQTAKEFPERFFGVNFSTKKHDMGAVLMTQLQAIQKRFPREEKDVAADFFAMRKMFIGGSWKFSESKNPLNPASHCDIAWAGGLSSAADALKPAMTFTSTLC